MICKICGGHIERHLGRWYHLAHPKGPEGDAWRKGTRLEWRHPSYHDAAPVPKGALMVIDERRGGK